MAIVSFVLTIFLMAKFASVALGAPQQVNNGIVDAFNLSPDNLVFQLNGQTFQETAPNAEREIFTFRLPPTLPPEQPITEAKLVQAPRGTSNYKCFLRSSNVMIEQDYLSALFGVGNDLDEPFSRADSMFCYDFSREDRAYFVVQTATRDIDIITTGYGVLLQDALATAINRGRTETILRMHVIQTPIPDLLCLLVLGVQIASWSPITPSMPLPYGENPSADSIMCGSLSGMAGFST